MTLVTLNGGSDLAAAAHDASPVTSQSLDDLPPPDTRRWVMRRKAEVVAGVRSGLLTFAEACARYGLSEEELASWQRLIDRHGVKALRVTRLQDYRRKIGAD